MSVYAPNEEGIQALRSTAQQVTQSSEEIRSETSTMAGIADEYSNTIGPHQAELQAILEEIRAALDQSVQPVEEVAQALNDVADGYQDVVDNNPFGGSGN